MHLAHTTNDFFSPSAFKVTKRYHYTSTWVTIGASSGIKLEFVRYLLVMCSISAFVLRSRRTSTAILQGVILEKGAGKKLINFPVFPIWTLPGSFPLIAVIWRWRIPI